MATKSFNVTKQYFADIFSGDANPGDSHVVLGPWAANSYVTRALLYAPVSFTGMSSINEARLYLRAHAPASGFHTKGASAATIHARRKTADWSETSGGVSSAVDELWGGDGDAYVESSFVGVESGDFANMPSLSDGAWYYVTITELVKRWLAGSPNYGVVLLNATSEAQGADQYGKQFYSRHVAGSVPYMWIDYSSNVAPNAPVSLSPSGDAVVHTGRTITFSGSRSDPDSGDYLTAYDIELRLDDGTSVILSHNSGVLSGTPTSFSKALTLPTGQNADTFYRWRARTRDKGPAWGPWSALQRFRPNTAPNAPVLNAIETDTLTPTFSAGFSDPDQTGVVHTGDDLAAIDIEVTRNASPYTSMWDSGAISKTGGSWSQLYGGSALSYGTKYRVRARVKDALGAWSAWSDWKTWEPTAPNGPDNLTPRNTSSKQNTLTPTLTVGHSAQFRNDRIQVYASNSLSSTLLWDKAKEGSDYALTSSVGRVYAGTPLAWGGTYYWRALVELNGGADTAWSDLKPFKINALPTAPTVTEIKDSTSGALAVTRSDGVAVIADSTPTIKAPFSDPDRVPYGDTPSARRIELRRVDTQVAHTGYPVTTGTTEEVTVGTALTENVIYEVRFGYRDDAGQPAGTYTFGPWRQLMYTRGPNTPGVTAPTAGGTVIEPTPLLDWTYSSPTSKAQRSFRIELFDRGPAGTDDEVLVYDSGEITSSATEYELPRGAIEDGRVYRWQLTVWDTDGLSAVLT